MISGDYCIRIKPVDNGFTVEVPDMEKIKEKEAADAKRKDSGNYPTYIGDCTESYIAKSVAEVLKLVKASLAELPDPEMQYSEAFAEAAKENGK
jgi:hypothetical protein